MKNMRSQFPTTVSTVREAEAAGPLLDESTFNGEYVDEAGDRRVSVAEDASDDGRYREGLPSGWFSGRKLWLFTGPGFLMSIAYLVSSAFRKFSISQVSKKTIRSSAFLCCIKTNSILPLKRVLKSGRLQFSFWEPRYGKHGC